jgi:hypothetical protein
MSSKTPPQWRTTVRSFVDEWAVEDGAEFIVIVATLPAQFGVQIRSKVIPALAMCLTVTRFVDLAEM